jgi:hypothetical protein
MAVEIIEQRLDDIYRARGVRKPADVTLSFSYQGRDYTIDLTNANKADFDDAIQPFLDAATEVTGRRKGGSVKKPVPVAPAVAPKKKPASKANTTATEADAIREWARKQNLQVSDRGRIADSVKAAYYAGHPKPSEAMPSRTLPVESQEPAELEDGGSGVEETDADFEELYSQI